jgi:hypothetical protein
MSVQELVVIGFGVLDTSGYHSLKGSFGWDQDQAGPADVKRSQVLSKLYPGFGKLNLPDRLAFGAASLALPAEFNGLETGIAIGISGGSLSTDLAYMDSVRAGTPSPALFSATLPSSAITDIAIYFGMKGPDRVFTGTGCPTLFALESAGMMIYNGKCTSVLVIGVWETTETDHCSAVALYLGHPEWFSSTVRIKMQGDNSIITDSVNAGEEKEIFLKIGKSLLNRELCRISVSESGWNGYISLTEGNEQENGRTA